MVPLKSLFEDYEAIVEVISKYVDGLIAGKKEIMQPAFHKDATMYGYNYGFLGGSITNLWDFVDEAGAATDCHISCGTNYFDSDWTLRYVCRYRYIELDFLDPRPSGMVDSGHNGNTDATVRHVWNS
ncbi:Putative lumazine-binding [Paenibacillus sp. OK060]|nr:Putative lumazine-binding [Paenibacillus sp. OK060]